MALPADLNGPGLAEAVGDLLKRRALDAEWPFLYASYSVAHPITQLGPSQRAAGDLGGVGSALRNMREWQAVELGLPIFTIATNPRSYLQNLKCGFDDIGERIEDVFPPRKEVLG